MTAFKIAIIGAGKVGSALAILLSERGYKVSGVASKSFDSAVKLASRVEAPAFEKPEEAAQNADIVFITTPDREIENVSRHITGRGGIAPGRIVAHTSGAHSSDFLAGVREKGGLAVSIHPLQSFADVEAAMGNLPGSYFALEGDPEALPAAERMVSDLKGRSFYIDARDKALYHAAACIASNYLVSIMHLSTGLYEKFGLSREEAYRALLPLIQGTISNIEKVGPVQALTGPVARGDSSTIEGHLPSLAGVGSEEESLYRTLGSYTVRVALEKGSISSEQAESLLKLFGGLSS
ncbi:MAG: NADP oxidoreductase [Peptococcaceae bacterium BICA1-7]|nr:MAG: NADP oxidoreductase [Peptococcaceae bacterium BICA1-7]HBV96188.1 DUF2520 domain-containing protein [Desulfotomaculum sp.]